MRREFVIQVSGRSCTASLEARPNQPWLLEIEGASYEVDAKRIRPGTWSILHEGRSFVVDLDERKRGVGVLAGTIDTEITIEDARRARLAATVSQGEGARGETVRAPIAGKVVKVLVAEGDEVEAGASVLVLEAMKMENEIRCENGGTVASVSVEAGQSVDSNDTLLTLS
ncbi:biotin/lipoyl-containing protein [Haliangium ochraceum]|uniref:Biotin/lipoyl attachment domain-containing protein n=1 Tax=Haliangium ochraceum (strain DSM 14365 / JCM 11303 / SMP-2) TaxID=502025 RepID=D0LT17_HALO1|nr:biotin/lipoyl-containing protein [Haliangium ochraceum]ACY19153.1 biotin/lipoyl attachment domain-containing protein [Haliangium ochraceum DSM 14365]